MIGTLLLAMVKNMTSSRVTLFDFSKLISLSCWQTVPTWRLDTMSVLGFQGLRQVLLRQQLLQTQTHSQNKLA
jgi:hypothetical protein